MPGKGKLTQEQQREIYLRYLKGELPYDIEDEYPVTARTLWRVVERFEKRYEWKRGDSRLLQRLASACQVRIKRLELQIESASKGWDEKRTVLMRDRTREIILGTDPKTKEKIKAHPIYETNSQVHKKSFTAITSLNREIRKEWELLARLLGLLQEKVDDQGALLGLSDYFQMVLEDDWMNGPHLFRREDWMNEKEVRGRMKDIWINMPKYCRKWFRLDLWEKQREILQMVRENRQTCIASGNSVGKTASMAALAICFLLGNYSSTVVTTSSSWKGVSKVLWPEIRKLIRTSRVNLSRNEVLDTEWQLGDGSEKWMAIGLSTKIPENFAGYHNRRVLVIVDEGSGLTQEIFDAIRGVAAGDEDRIVLIGNPLRPTGPFADCFRKQGWAKLFISSMETPNYVQGKNVIPGLATRAWVEQMKREWGEHSPAFIARVLGQFPPAGPNALFSLQDLHDACGLPMIEEGERSLGCDVARFGDDKTVIIIKTPGAILYAEEHFHLDTMGTVGRIINLRKEWGVRKVYVDDSGVGGGVTDRLHELGIKRVARVTNASTSDEPDRFLNRRAQSFWELALNILEGKLHIPEQYLDRLLELAAVQRTFHSSGAMKIIPKEDIKKELGHSPDWSDALALCYSGVIAPTFEKVEHPR